MGLTPVGLPVTKNKKRGGSCWINPSIHHPSARPAQPHPRRNPPHIPQTVDVDSPEDGLERRGHRPGRDNTILGRVDVHEPIESVPETHLCQMGVAPCRGRDVGSSFLETERAVRV